MIKLRDGDIICPECKGKTLVSQIERLKSGGEKLMACPICLGSGKLDWIDAVKGEASLSMLAPHRQDYWIGKRNQLNFKNKGFSNAEYLYATRFI